MTQITMKRGTFSIEAVITDEVFEEVLKIVTARQVNPLEFGAPVDDPFGYYKKLKRDRETIHIDNRPFIDNDPLKWPPMGDLSPIPIHSNGNLTLTPMPSQSLLYPSDNKEQGLASNAT